MPLSHLLATRQQSPDLAANAMRATGREGASDVIGSRIRPRPSRHSRRRASHGPAERLRPFIDTSPSR
jgi:hypothetical protein